MKHLERWRDRHGKVRLYYRAGHGPRTSLRGPVGSPEFWEDYQAAAGEAKKGPEGPASLRWLVQHYYTGAAYKGMRVGTRQARRRILDRFCDLHGHKRFAKLQPRHLREIRDRMMDTPDAANNTMKALRQVFKYAVAYDHVTINPLIGVERLKSKNPDGIHAWTLAEVERFEATHEVGTRARLALALLLYTAQRRGDVIRLGRQHINRQGKLDFRQEKTNKQMKLPILDVLQQIIDASPTGDLTYLVSPHGKAYSAGGFSNWFRRRCIEAGLPHCSAHGLRKARASRLAELGYSTHEIMAWTGHESLQVVEGYTKAADQERLAERVRERIEGKDR